MRSHQDYSPLLFLAALLLLASPFSRWWSTLQLPWYTLFIVWAGVIVLAALNHRRSARDDD